MSDEYTPAEQHVIPPTRGSPRSAAPSASGACQRRVVDEMIFAFTHAIEVDWMLPGIAPTGRRVEVPLVVVVQLDGDAIECERIYGDQASVLAQLGLVDAGALPVVGAEAAQKVLDPSLPSNALIGRARPAGASAPGWTARENGQ